MSWKAKVASVLATVIAVPAAAASPALADNTVLWYLSNNGNADVEVSAAAETFKVEWDVYTAMGIVEHKAYVPDGGSCAYNTKYNAWRDVARTTLIPAGQNLKVCDFVVDSYSWVHADITGSRDGATYVLAENAYAEINNPTVGKMDFKQQGTAETGQGADVRFSLRKADEGHYDLDTSLDYSVPEESASTQLMSLRAERECTITGTAGDDVLVGTDGEDVICAGAGDDVIYGKGGNDVIFAGPGDDRVDGGAGDDYIGGGAGNDRVDGGAGDDVMHGATGEDILVGGEGNDLTDGGSGDDALLPRTAATDEMVTARSADVPSVARQPRRIANPGNVYFGNVNALASSDSFGNVLEDGDGDGFTAQGTEVSIPDGDWTCDFTWDGALICR